MDGRGYDPRRDFVCARPVEVTRNRAAARGGAEAEVSMKLTSSLVAGRATAARPIVWLKESMQIAASRDQ
jgi:hypothetical protein